MEYVLMTTWLLIIVLAVYATVKYLKDRGVVLKFQNYGKVDIPYVTIDMQGVPLNMIVDTGCGVSILSSEAVEQLACEDSPRQISLSAMTSDTVNSKMVSITMDVNGKAVTSDFCLYPGADIANFGRMYGIAIHGILGNEFLEKTGCTIDYRKHAITLR